MLRREEIERLLNRLCTELGFCLTPDQQLDLANSPPMGIKSFTDAVFIAEGLDPNTADRQLYRQVLEMVREVFRKAADAQS